MAGGVRDWREIHLRCNHLCEGEVHAQPGLDASSPGSPRADIEDGFRDALALYGCEFITFWPAEDADVGSISRWLETDGTPSLDQSITGVPCWVLFRIPTMPASRKRHVATMAVVKRRRVPRLTKPARFEAVLGG